jgi:hypothetical protein
MEPISAVSYRRAQRFPCRPWQRPSVREPCRRSGTSRVRSAQSGDAWDRVYSRVPDRFGLHLRQLRVFTHIQTRLAPKLRKAACTAQVTLLPRKTFYLLGGIRLTLIPQTGSRTVPAGIAFRSGVLLVVVWFIACLAPSFQPGPKLRRWAAAALSHACHAAMIAPLEPPLAHPPDGHPQGPRSDGQPRSTGSSGTKMKDGRYVGLDVYDLLIEERRVDGGERGSRVEAPRASGRKRKRSQESRQ